MAKVCFTDEEQFEILQSSSDGEYPEDKEEDDKEENNVQIEEEIDNEMEASTFQKEEDSEKEVTAALCITIQTFSSKSGMQWRSKASVVTKREACNIFPANPGLQNDARSFIGFRSVPAIYQ